VVIIEIVGSRGIVIEEDKTHSNGGHHERWNTFILFLAKCNFLRRSKPSGTPKPWAPSKPKQNDRPEDVKQFKAKPLPKFIRQRLASRDQEC